MKEILRLGFLAAGIFISAASYTMRTVNAHSRDFIHPDEWYCSAEAGHYQIEVLIRARVSYPYDLCRQINDNRHSEKQVVIFMSEFVRLRILSSGEIAAGFLFKEEVVYVRE